jgi:hypothetical protein
LMISCMWNSYENSHQDTKAPSLKKDKIPLCLRAFVAIIFIRLRARLAS